jgi:elongation factor Ts
MTAISAALVKELRERTGAAMMDCKRALEETQGSLDNAVEVLRKSGRAKADKKAGRTAAEGRVEIAESDDNRVIMVEVNSETDFVAKDQNFVPFVKAVAETVLHNQIETVAELLEQKLIGDESHTVEEARQALVAKVGENVQIRRIVLCKEAAAIGTYVHSGKIGAIVAIDIDDKELARVLAMQVAASHPKVISPEDVDQATVAKEKEIFLAQSASSGKPQAIIEKMVEGRLKKFLDEISLVGQPFVKDPEVTVGSLLNKHHAKVIEFYRFEVGEGIEKTAEDFKEAVMSQVKGN